MIDKNIYINGFLFNKGNTGVQRYANNIIKNFNSDLNYKIIKSKHNNKVLLHFSEQFITPLLYRNQLVWSPTHMSSIFLNRSIITVHDLLPIDCPQYFDKKVVYYYNFILPKLIKNAIHLFTVSNFTKNRIIEKFGVNENKISLTYNASIFDNSIFYNNNNFNFLKNKFQIKNKYFLVVGNIGNHKNSFNLIEYFSKTNLNANLIFIGKLPNIFNSYFINLISKDKRIIHLVNIDDETLANFYLNACATILFSYYEGFGIPLIEANSLGCPVIYNVNSVMSEFAGDFNYPVDINSFNDFNNAISNLFNKNKSFQDLINNSKKYNWVNESNKVSKILKNYL
jgi:glycosyltransferase involved in cell wall biosynthesis